MDFYVNFEPRQYERRGYLLRSLVDRYAVVGETALPQSLPLLGQRLGVEAIFLLPARTKVEGWSTISEGTFELFRTDHALPLIPPDVAAVAATISEHVSSLLLVFGLFTRLSVTALLKMTLAIQVFVYPDAWPTHLVFNIWQQVEHLSVGMTLEPGDVLFTGTPGGIGAAMDPRKFLKAGDVVRCEIDKLGTIEGVMRDEG